MLKVDANEFSLSWWRIDKANLKLSKAIRESSLVAITINSANHSEIKAIKQWCKDNPVYKLYRSENWDETFGQGDTYIYYWNNQRTVLAEPDVMSQLEAWLATLPRRDIAVLLEMDLASLRKTTKRHNVRIVTSIDNPNLHVVSVSDSALSVELALRSD
jgi:hypothetical protein